MTLQVRYRSTGQEWTRWQDERPGEGAVEAALDRNRDWVKVTVLTDFGQKIQWRRKP